MTKPTATLSAGAAVAITRSELKNLSTPLRTVSHKPVAHSTMVDLVEMGLQRHGLVIEKESYAVQSAGMKLFGVITLSHSVRTDYSFALGLRTSNDKTIPVQLVAGARVFVCQNGVFSGDVETLDRRHTAGLDIRSEIFAGVSRAVEKFGKLDTRIQELKRVGITDMEAKAIMLDAALTGVMPLHLLPDVSHSYFEPTHDEFKLRTKWALHNAFTETFKSLRPNVAMQSNIELGAMMAFAL